MLDAVDSLGLDADGRLFALNSYENRVYQVGTAQGMMVLKFYRPGRWSDAQIIEEHQFAQELAAKDLAVATPWTQRGRSLFEFEGFRFSVFHYCAGRSPDFSAPQALRMLGRALGRLHAIGRVKMFRAREQFSAARRGHAAREAVLNSGMLDDALADRYSDLSAQLLDRIEAEFAAVGRLEHPRIHGDCHPGNILWTPSGPLFVDLDDSTNGPAVQDLWMFLNGDSDAQRGQWAELSAGYLEFTDLNYVELRLVEALRGLRILHHVGWIAARWDDPAFPRAFPDFAAPRFWEGHLNEILEQLAAIEQPPLLSA